jgi:SAM-dependent methyltransferase
MRLLGAAAIAMLGTALASLAQTPARVPDVGFVPTPPEAVAAMLRLAGVRSDDVVYDLGSGDGRIVIAAAKRYGARGVGVEIEAQRITDAVANARVAGVAGRVQFRQQDLFETDLRDATVVTLYLLPRLNLALRSKLLAELRPGARIVSYGFDMGEWKPDRTVRVGSSNIYLWTIPPDRTIR